MDISSLFFTEEGKEGIKCIIQRDIENFADFYWVEASGAVEHWIQKYRGFPIPNIYAPMILNKKKEDIQLSKDGLHYSRIIGVSTEPMTKAIYGFRNEAVFDLVTKDIENYLGFVNVVNNKLKEAVFDYSKEESNAMYVVDLINEYYNNRMIDELTPHMYKALIASINVLKKSSGQNETIKSYTEIGDFLLSDMEVLKLHKMSDAI